MIAAAACWHSRRAFDLGPRFHCGTCTLEYKDLAAKPFQCPKCDLSVSYQEMLKDARELAADLFGPKDKPGEWPFADWSLDRGLAIYTHIAGLLSDSDGKVLDEWDELTAELARIILQERSYAEFVDHHNHLSKLKSMSNKRSY